MVASEKGMKVACEICGKKFHFRKGKRFCSSTCRFKAFEERKLSVYEEKAKKLQINLDALKEENNILIEEVIKLKEKYPVELCGHDIRGLSKKEVMKIIVDFRISKMPDSLKKQIFK